MITPIDKMSVTDKVIDSLRSYIQEPSRCEGEKLPTETELSQRLGVGRSTVREALRVLQTMGYVKIVHGKGAFIQSQSPSNNPAEQWIAENYYTLNEIYSVREILEPPIAAMASENATVQECEGLLQLVSDLGQALNLPREATNPNYLAQLDRAFHEKICEMTHNSILISIYQNISSILETYRINSFSIYENQRNVFIPHSRIADAIAAHDSIRASAEMRKHIEISREDSQKALQTVTSKKDDR